MQNHLLAAVAAALLVAAPVVGCAPAASTTPAPVPAAAAPTTPPAAAAAASARPARAHSEADVRFVRDMIQHHEQALQMAALAPDRAASEPVRLLARRIEMSQADEIELMRRWLRQRGEAVPGAGHPGAAHHGEAAAHAHQGHHAGHGTEPAAMPGMLSAEQMAALEAARGTGFDGLFLQLMIFHHEGALTMVEQLFESPASAQDAELFQIAAHIDGDQRIEIGRMQRLLAAVPR